jgi:hypothetical protein
MARWELEVSPELEPLCRALSELRISIRSVADTIERLTKPPESLHVLPPDHVQAANALLNEVLGPDRDMAARTLRLREGNLDHDATWKGLTRAERKRAKRSWDWVLDTSLESSPQGRPSKVDTALILYCSRIVAEACGRQQFRFSRPPHGGAPSGPMWRALMAAVPLAEMYLRRMDGVITPTLRKLDGHAEVIAEIVTVARSKRFTARCRELGLGPSADHVALQPASFRLAMMQARAPRRARRA